MSLDQVIKDINKKHDSNVIKRGVELEEIKRIPFSSPRANYITYGGIPLGKGTELIGEEGGGKTTTAIDIVKNAQIQAKKELEVRTTALNKELKGIKDSDKKKDKKRVEEINVHLANMKQRGPRKIIYIDTENTLDTEWATINGVDTEDMILSRPEMQTAEDILQDMIEMLQTGEVYLMVLDSIPMLVSQKLYEEDIDKRAYGGIADAMARFTGKVSSILSSTETALVMINQKRDDLANPFNQWHTTGGRALKHFYSLRLGFRQGSMLDEDNKEVPNRTENPSGHRVSMSIVKTKVCKPNRKLGYYTLNYTTGIDVIEDTIDMAMQYNIIYSKGAWFYFVDTDTGEIMKDDQEKEMKFQGKANLLNFLRENTFIYEELWNEVNEKLQYEN